jgi:hypothetical protein
VPSWESTIVDSTFSLNALAAVLCLGLIATWKLADFNFRAVYDEATAEARRTQKFRADLDDLASQAQLNPTWPIVLDAHKVSEWEAVGSFNSWSAYKAIMNPIVLRVAIPTETIMTPFQAELVEQMKVWAAQGLPGHFVPFENLSRLVAEGHCIVAGALIDPTLLQCHQQHLSLE